MSYPTVAHVKDQYLPRSETFVYTLISSLSRYRPIILDRYRQQNRDIFPIDRHYSPANHLGMPAALLERAALRWLGYSPYLENVIRRESVKLVHAHFGQLGSLFVPVARRHDLPLITSFYDMAASVLAFQPRWKRRFDKLWEQATFCVALGPAMAQQLESAGCPSEKIRVVPLSIDLNAFPYARRERAPGEPVRILSVARLIPKKGMDILLRALARIKSDHALELVVAGDGPERPKLEKLVTELELENEVRFCGWLGPKEVAASMGEAHLFALASHTDPITGEKEGSPTVLLEAQARGLPVISTFHADIPYVVENGHTGLLVPERDVDRLAGALQTLINTPEKWNQYGREGRDLVESRHGMGHVASLVEGLYDECLR